MRRAIKRAVIETLQIYSCRGVRLAVNMVGILGNAETYPEGLVGGPEWGSPGEECEKGARALPK